MNFKFIQDLCYQKMQLNHQNLGIKKIELKKKIK